MGETKSDKAGVSTMTFGGSLRLDDLPSLLHKPDRTPEGLRLTHEARARLGEVAE